MILQEILSLISGFKRVHQKDFHTGRICTTISSFIYIFMYIYIFIYIFVHLCVYIYIYIYILFIYFFPQ